MILEAAAVVSVLLALPTQAKDNPDYPYWASGKVGSWVKLKMEMEQGGQPIEAEITITLVDLTPEKAVLEQTGKATVAGKTVNMPTGRQEVLAKVEKTEKIEKESEEEIEIAGHKLACRVVEATKEEEEGRRIWSRAWMTLEIPGGVAKAEQHPEGEAGPAMTVTALEWEKK